MTTKEAIEWLLSKDKKPPKITKAFNKSLIISKEDIESHIAKECSRFSNLKYPAEATEIQYEGVLINK